MKPILQALLLADHVYQDAGTQKFIIAGTFNQLKVIKSQTQPSDEQPSTELKKRSITEVQRAGSPWIYISLTDVKGTVPLQIRYESLSGDSVWFTADMSVKSDDPLKTIEIAFPMPVLPVVFGVHCLELLYEGESLGSHRVTVPEIENVDN